MEVVLQLTEEQLLYLQAEAERHAHAAYMEEDLSKGKFYEELVQQLERERWK